MLEIKETIIVEGKYDKERVKRVCSAPIICTNGFGIFKSKELVESIRHLARTTGIIVLTDSDRAGFLIRSYIKNCVGASGTVKHAFIPSVKGKEKRKDKPGKEGLIGVEGMDDRILTEIIERLSTPISIGAKLTKAELYGDGLSGKPGSLEKRQEVLKRLSLPTRLSPSALIDIINKTGAYDEYKAAVFELNDTDGEI